MQQKVIYYIKKALQLLGKCALPGLGEFKFMKHADNNENNTAGSPVPAGVYKLVLTEGYEREYSMLTAYIRLHEKISEEIIDEEIKAYVVELKSRLYNDKTMALDTLGILTLGENGEILFTSNLFLGKNIDNTYGIEDTATVIKTVCEPVNTDKKKNETENIVSELKSNHTKPAAPEELPLNEKESETSKIAHSFNSPPLLKAKNKNRISPVLLLILIFTSLMIVYTAFKKPMRTKNPAAVQLKDSTILPHIDTVVPVSFIDTHEILVTITNKITAEESGRKKLDGKAAKK